MLLGVLMLVNILVVSLTLYDDRMVQSGTCTSNHTNRCEDIPHSPRHNSQYLLGIDADRQVIYQISV